MTFLQLTTFLILLTSLAGCGGSGTSPAAPTAADLQIGTSGTATGPVGTVDATFPVFSQYSVTGISPSSPTNVWDRVVPSSVRVQAVSTAQNGVPVGSTFVTVSFAIKNGSQPQASQFSSGATAEFRDLNALIIPSGQISPTFTIANVR
jgi:hypothetical protein